MLILKMLSAHAQRANQRGPSRAKRNQFLLEVEIGKPKTKTKIQNENKHN